MIIPESLRRCVLQDNSMSSAESEARLQVTAEGIRRKATELLADICGIVPKPEDSCFQIYMDRAYQAAVEQANAAPSPDEFHLPDSLDDQLLGDALLAQALLLGVPEAAAVFESRYARLIEAVAMKIAGPRGLQTVENLVADLILPREDRAPRLATYKGRTSLAGWLRVVVVNRCRALGRKMESVAFSEGTVGLAGDQEPAPYNGDCEQLLMPVFREAAASLEDDQRGLLKLLILEGVPQKQMALTLGVAEGTLTRRKQKATRQLFKRIHELVTNSSSVGAAQECLDEIVAGSSQPLRQRLGELLSGAVAMDSPAEGTG